MNAKAATWLKNEKNISQLNSLRTSIMQSAAVSKNESETASIFEKNLYYIVKNELGIELKFNKETEIDNVCHKFEG